MRERPYFYMAPKEKVDGQPIHNETLRQKDRVMTELWKAKAPKEQPNFGESLRSMNRVSRPNDLFILFFYSFFIIIVTDVIKT